MWPESSLQPAVIKALRASIDAGPSHAYLFVGSPGVGRFEVARWFAAALVCTGSEGVLAPELAVQPPCGVCLGCQRIDRGVHPDVLEFEPEGNSYLVEQVRHEIIPEASLAPSEGAMRVLMVREAERLNPASSNALLKTLEEPLGHVAFILIAAPSAEVMLETIRSRCQVVKFEHLTPLVIADALEKSGADRHLAQRAARLAGGRLDRASRLVRDDGALAARDEIVGMLPRLRMGSLASAIALSSEFRQAVHTRLETLTGDQEAEVGVLRSDLKSVNIEGRDADSSIARLRERQKRESRRARGDLYAEAFDTLESWYRDVALLQARGRADLLVNPEWEAQLRDAAAVLPARVPLSALEFIARSRSDWLRNPREELWLDRLFSALYALEQSAA